MLTAKELRDIAIRDVAASREYGEYAMLNF
jgi:hypothetical protein